MSDSGLRTLYLPGGTREASGRPRRLGDALTLDPDFAAAALGAMTERCAYIWFIFGDPAEPVDPETAATKITSLWLATLGLPG